MKIELDSSADTSNKIDAYSVGQVTITKNIYQSSLLISPNSIVPDWSPQQFSELTAPHIQQILTFEHEIVLLGTGKTLMFPNPAVMRPLVDHNVGFEIMDTGGACRSYNFLVNEGRLVVAAIMMIE